MRTDVGVFKFRQLSQQCVLFFAEFVRHFNLYLY